MIFLTQNFKSTKDVLDKSITNADYYFDHILKGIVWYGPRIIFGILLIIIGFWLIRLITSAFKRLMIKRGVDSSIIPFIKSVASISLKMILLVSVLAYVGVNTTSFITALGAAGLAIGLALQGSLSNFAGGILILLFKPFRVGDFIQVQLHKGTVKEVQILYTIIITTDNKRIVIPNGSLSNRDIINYTSEQTRRIDIMLNLDYSIDVKKTEKILHQIAVENELILKDPAPLIGLHDLTNGVANIEFCVWVKRTDYQEVLYAVNYQIKQRFDEEKITMSSNVPAINIINQPLHK